MKIILGKVRPFLRRLAEAHPQVLIIALQEMIRRGARCPVTVRLWSGTPISTYVVIAGRSGLGKSESAKPDASPWPDLKAPTYLQTLAARKVTLSAEDAAEYIARQAAQGLPIPTVVPAKTPTGTGTSASANGKTAANGKAAGGITGPSAPILIPYRFDRTKSLGSGQVLSDNLIDVIGKGEDSVVTMKPFPCVVLAEDEMSAMLRAAKNETSTTIATLNSAWAGAEIGNDTRMHGDRRTTGPYNVFLTGGLQPKLGAELFCHDDSGFLQRNIFTATSDPYIFINKPDIPRPLVKPSGALPHMDGTSVFTADAQVMSVIEEPGVDYQLDHLFDEYEEKMSHAPQVQIRLACLGALLHGTLHITWELWEWAGAIMEHSRLVFIWMEHQAKEEERTKAKAEGEYVSTRKAAEKDYGDQQVEALAVDILRKITDKGVEGIAWNNLYKNLAKSRQKWLRSALDLLVARNLIFLDGARYKSTDFKAAS